MNLKLKRIAPVQAGKMIGALYALFSLIFVPFILLFMTIGSMAARSQGGNVPALPFMFGMGVGFVVFIPVIYGVLGFIFGALAALIYNLLAKPLGGFALEFESDQVPPAL
jgi:hypothetical protein